MRNVVAIVLALGAGLGALWTAEALRAQDESPVELVDPVVVERRPLLDRVERLRDDLVVVDEHLAGRGTAAHDAVDRMRRELREIRAALRDAPAGRPADAPAGPARHAVLGADDFAALRDSVRSATFKKPQVEIVAQACRHGWFTSEQAEALVRAAFDDDARVEMGFRLYPRVVDRQRFFRVVDALDLEVSRERLRAGLREIDESDERDSSK